METRINKDELAGVLLKLLVVGLLFLMGCALGYLESITV